MSCNTFITTNNEYNREMGCITSNSCQMFFALHCNKSCQTLITAATLKVTFWFAKEVRISSLQMGFPIAFIPRKLVNPFFKQIMSNCEISSFLSHSDVSQLQSSPLMQYFISKIHVNNYMVSNSTSSKFFLKHKKKH